MKLFNFFAKYIGYSFSIGLFSGITSWMMGIFGVYIGSSFILISYDKILLFVLKWLPISVIISSFFHLLQTGLLEPIRIPPFFNFMKRMNSAYRRDMNLEDDELRIVYEDFSYSPMYTMMISVTYVIFTGLIFAGFSSYEYFYTKTISFEEFIVFVKIIIIAVSMVVILVGITTYLLTEALTLKQRSKAYNNLIKKNIRIKPIALIGIRIKFMFFVLLMIITLFTFAALIEKGRYYDEYDVLGIVIYLIISTITGIIMMLINSNSFLNILKDMRSLTREISKGGRAAFNAMSLEKEFSSIQFSLMEMAWEIDGHRKNLEDKVEQRTEELQNALVDLKDRDNQMQKQLDMASVIQRSILPGTIDDWNELKFAVKYIAMDKIGGDFYDIQQLKDGKLGVLIADVSGHGIPAALVTTMAKISFGNAAQNYSSPKRIFQEVNHNILDHVKTQDYLTCFMCAFDEDYGMVYSNASHQKAILLRTETGQIELLDTGGLFLGAIEEAIDTYEENKTKLNYADRLILYTDGIPEALDKNRTEYSNDRFEKMILDNRTMALEDFSNLLIEDVYKHLGNSPMEDDITLLVIELVKDEVIDIIKQARKKVNLHEHNEAIQILEDGLKRYPYNQKLLYNLAKNYFRVNNYVRTVKAIERYLENDKKNKYAYYIAGAAHLQLENFEDAIVNFEQSLYQDSKFVNSIFALGITYKKVEKYEDAKQNFERVLNFEPENKMALFEINEINKQVDTNKNK